MPSWIAQSTVAKAPALNDVLSNTSFIPAKAIVPRDVKPIVATEAATTSFDSYYASLEQEGEEEPQIMAARVPLPPSAGATPASSSSATATPKVEPVSDTEVEFTTSRSASLPNGNVNGAGSGKRSREDSIMSDGIVEGKKARVEEEAEMAVSSLAGSVAGEEEEDEFEEIEEDSDPNPMISVGGKLMPFEDVKDSDELTGAMVCLLLPRSN